MLGDCALPELTTKRLQSFVTTLANYAHGERKRADTENHREHSADSILDCFHGPRLGLYDSDSFPCRAFVFATRHTKAVAVLCAARYAAHRSGCRWKPLGTICFLLSVTGMRIGEVLALRVQDLDFHRKLIKVRCSTYAGQIGTPKSKASIGDLPMPPALESRLKRYLSSRHFRENDLGLLFANRRGRPYSANKLREKKLRPLRHQVAEYPWPDFMLSPCGSQRTD